MYGFTIVSGSRDSPPRFDRETSTESLGVINDKSDLFAAYMKISMNRKDSIEYRVFAAAKDGMAITLYAMLCSKKPPDVQKILSTKTGEDGQVTTPFLIAARNGHDTVVRMLLTYFKVDIEQTGLVRFDGYQIEGATALWCAAGGGHMKTVQQLLLFNADVNHATVTNSTPLRAACFDGRLDIVALLIENNADLTIPNKYNNTCLMIAAYKGHGDVVHHLLEKKADPDMVAHCGATALHFCAERGHLSIVRDLVNAGASMLKNDQGMTPLHMASEAGSADIVEFFVNHPKCSRKDRVEALELLGASYANDREIYDMDKCYHYMWLAMQERYSGQAVDKEIKPPIEAYENRVECRTIEELDAIKDDHNALHLEALIVRERILGENNIEIPHHIIFRGAVFADTSRFDRCTTLWKRALELRQKNDRLVNKDLLRFAQVFCQMFHAGEKVEYSLVEDIFEHILFELKKDQGRLKAAESQEDIETAHDSYDVNIHTALYMLAILTKVQKNKEEDFRLCRLVYRFNQLKLSLHTKPGYTPLHMVCDETTQIDDFHVNDVVQFPSDTVVKLLLKCGADPNQVDVAGNTPLHVIVKYNRPISDFLTLHNIITALLDANIHLDRANTEGITPAEASTTGVAEIILRTTSKRQINLKCLAARVVRKNKIPYRGEVPQALYDYIEMH